MRRCPTRPFAVTSVLVAGLLLAGAVRTPALADAPPITPEGAQALSAALKDGIKRWFPNSKDGPRFEWKGDLVATPAGDHYDVALPALSAIDPDGSRIDVGSVRMTVKPLEGGTHAVTATLPDSIPILDGGKPSATITLGKQRLSGVWAPAYETFLSMDAELANLSVVGAKNDGALTIGAVTANGDLKPDGATTYSGPGALAISNLVFRDEKNRDILKLGTLALEGTYSRVDLGRVASLQRMSQQTAGGGAQPPAADLLSAMQGLMGGMSFRVRLADLSGLNPEDGTKGALTQLAIRGGVEDLDRPLGSASLGFDAEGLTLTPAVAPESFMPKRVNLQLSAAKLPANAFWKAFADLAAAGEPTPPAKGSGKGPAKKGPETNGADAAAEAAFGRLFTALSEAGTEARIDTLAVDTPATSGSVTGSARVAANSAMGAVGGATILLRGLDGAAKALQPKPGQKADKETQDTLGFIAMLQAMGQVSKDETGKDVRTYKIDLTETGQVLLNGADMGPLLGGAGMEVEEEEEEPAPKKGARK